MEPDTEVLFGLRKREHPSEPLVKTRRWFPTLMKICLFKVARFIVQAINKEVDKESPWTKRRWISLKVFLHDHVPKFLLEDLHKSYIIDNDDFNEVRCQICSEILLRPYGEDSKLSNWKNDVKLILADWLLKPFDDEDRHFVESSRQIDLSVLVPFDVHVTSIRFSNKTLGLKTLAKCLRRLVGLKEVRFDYTQTGDGMEFKLLKKYCRLKKFELRRSREAKFRPKTVENFLAFLRSQSDCIEELNLLHGIIWFKTEEMTFARIWEVVTGLRELTFLQLNNEDLTLIDVAALPPCQNVKTLFVKIFFDWKFAQGFPFKKLFPMVENVCLGNEHDFQTVEDSSDSEPGEIFQNATYFDAPIFVNPFWLMTFMPMVRQLSLNCWRGCSDYFEVNLPHLTDLELALTEFDDGTGSLHFKHFKSLFGSFPNLINFHLQLERLEDFDEKNFIDFLPGVKEKITNLKKLKLEIEKHPKEMTGASVCAFLRNSNLEMFEDFGKFKFSHRDFAELKDLAEDKNLIILPAIKIADDDFDIESGPYFHPCDNGKHKLFPGFPIKRSSREFSF